MFSTYFFIILSWMATAVAVVTAVISLIKDRSLIIKPSFVFTVSFILQVQLGIAAHSKVIYEVLEKPWIFFVMIHIFSIVCLMGSIYFYRETNRKIFNVLQEQETTMNRPILSISLFVLCCLITMVYLIDVPIADTGLYHSIFSPETAYLAREQSFKLLDSAFTKYSYEFLSKVFAPLAAIVLFLQIEICIREKKVIPGGGYLIAFLLVLISVSLYGARGPAAMVVMVVLYAYYIKSGAKLNPMFIVVMFLIILILPAFLTVLKNGLDFSLSNALSAMINMIDRTFIRGAKTNYWYEGYVEQFGFFGVSGIPKIANLLGREALDIYNIVGHYNKPHEATISASASFVMLNYACFGAVVFFPSLIIVMLTDLLLFVYRRLGHYLMLPCIAACLLPLFCLSITQFTTVLTSKGLLIIPLFCLACSKILARKYEK